MASAPSLRSLSSLQPVPPPKNPPLPLGAIDTSFARWDTFPAEARDAPESRHSTSDERTSREPRDDAESARAEPIPPYNPGHRHRASHGARPPRAAPTPPRNSQPRHHVKSMEAVALHTHSPRRLSRSSRGSLGGTSARSRSSTPVTKNRREGLIKVGTDGSLASSSRGVANESKRQSKARYRSESPMLTRGRVDQLDKESHDVSKSLNGGSKRSVGHSSGVSSEKQSKQRGSSSSPVQPSNGTGGKSKMFLVGTSKVYSRTLIPPTIYNNPATDNWIVTINTSSKLSRKITNSTHVNGSAKCSGQKAFSFRTEQEARASAYANAPPVMVPFDSCKECTLCNSKFTLFKRPRHCRNCGICICSNYACSTQWSKLQIPATYNAKKQNTVNVCASCNSLSKRFKHALLNGRYGTAVELYLTGNVNLRVPFVPKDKGKEALFPIHAAIEGQSEKLLRWLVEVQHCPLHVISTGNAKSGGIGASMMHAGAGMLKSLNTKQERTPMFTPTLKTSKGRGVIDVAMEARHVGILRYLVNEKNVSVYEVEDLDLALGAVEALAKAFPVVDGSLDPTMFREKKPKGSSVDVSGASGGTSGGEAMTEDRPATKSAKKSKKTEDASPKKEKVRSHSFLPPPKEEEEVHGLYGAIGGYDGNDSTGSHEDEEEDDTIILEDDASVVSTTVPDTCLLCRQRGVDCMAAPCGHQTCCLQCSNQLVRCPICDLDCHFIEIYNP